jgi:hypothetical protein
MAESIYELGHSEQGFESQSDLRLFRKSEGARGGIWGSGKASAKTRNNVEFMHLGDVGLNS